MSDIEHMLNNYENKQNDIIFVIDSSINPKLATSFGEVATTIFDFFKEKHDWIAVIQACQETKVIFSLMDK